MTLNTCEICGNSQNNRIYNIQPIQEFPGLNNNPFEYFECSECGCLQIVKIPEKLPEYYSFNYYSFENPQVKETKGFLKFMKRKRAENCLGSKNLLGEISSKISRVPYYFDWLTKVNVTLESKILDVGCGAGDLLVRLAQEGFSNLTGLDPLVERDILYKNGVKIIKKEIAELEDQFDLIMMHHSFEHIPQPREVLQNVWRLLKRDRYALIRIPVTATYAWREYGVKWGQIEPPIHLFLHTQKSMSLLATEVGFQIKDVVYDSWELQFLCGKLFSDFSESELKEFKLKAEELNKNNDGDQAAFYLYKP
ncbi:class I SAM-dependent methyltransferase [Microcoleus sp. herbarium14]|uniref:class I SAM-dependent methyltransferase n=1 Tax=Microcoleus sp. herbarium14 TaxID=3055439 RepID=UPI002FCFBD06